MGTELPGIAEGRHGKHDVLVAGGGMAGIAAAIAAARSGARTLLIERSGALGGLGVTGATGLHTFFNVFGAHPGAEKRRVVGGIAQELVDRTAALGGAIGHVPMEKGGDFVSMLTPVEPEAFRLAAVRACREAGVDVLFHTVLDSVRAGNGAVEGVIVWNKAGRSIQRAGTYVDATGDGDLAAWAGAPFTGFKAGDEGAYHVGFTFRLCNVDLGEMERDLDRRGLLTQAAHAVKPGTGKREAVRIGIDTGKLREAGADWVPWYFLASSLRPRELTYCNCVNAGPMDGLDAAALSLAEQDLREQMFHVVEMFRAHIGGCAECYPAGAAPAGGVRRGRAVRCEYELTRDDVTSGREFPDQVARFGFIDNGRYFVKEAGAYGIPYRALVPRGLENALVAGRMMTLDTVAHNSTRNTVCCLACGQAAGTAAALASRSGGRAGELDFGKLRDALLKGGAILSPVPDPR